MIILKNATLILKEKPVKRHISLLRGKIHKISKSLPQTVSKAQIIDLKGKYVLPGIIDAHTHLRDMGLKHKEDFRTATRAAAAGGITTVFDMPNGKPLTITASALKEKRAAAKKKAIVNYGFHFGSFPGFDTKEITKVKNVASTKIFMNLSTGKTCIEDSKLILDIFRKSRMIMVHAEEEKVHEAIKYAKKTKKKLYLCHLSLKSEIDYVRKHKTKKIFAEVTPHHLFLTQKDVKRLKSFGLMKPNLRTKKDQTALWKAISDGTIDTIGSDHAPHTKKEKQKKEPPFGVPGLETTLPLMLDAVNKKKLSLTQLVRLTSLNPAKIFGIKNKGLLKEGYDADLVIVDMNLEKKVENKKLFTKCKWSPFNGMKLKGWPVMTIVNGNIVYHNHKIKNTNAQEVMFDAI
jgi:dihydroorotase